MELHLLVFVCGCAVRAGAHSGARATLPTQPSLLPSYVALLSAPVSRPSLQVACAAVTALEFDPSGEQLVCYCNSIPCLLLWSLKVPWSHKLLPLARQALVLQVGAGTCSSSRVRPLYCCSGVPACLPVCVCVCGGGGVLADMHA